MSTLELLVALTEKMALLAAAAVALGAREERGLERSACEHDLLTGVDSRRASVRHSGRWLER